jgi:SAM-dependent methyltransferase
VRAYDRLVTGQGPFSVAECAHCEYGVTVPQLSPEGLEPYYADAYYEDYFEHSGPRAPASALARARARFRRAGAARRHARPPFSFAPATPGRVLDVGCGSGELLEHYARAGWETYGIDPSEAALSAAARRGAHVHRGTLDDQPWGTDPFGLITFQHALEHIVDPLVALRRARDLLAPDGLILVAVPNWSCWQRRLLFRNRWCHLDLPRHQQHFSPRALARAADQVGLSVGAVGTSSTVISSAYSVHYLLAGRWTPGWKLWLSLGLCLLIFPLVRLGDLAGGGDCCFIAMAHGGGDAGQDRMARRA